MKAARRPGARALGVAALTIGVSLVLTGPALHGPLLSDDHLYLSILPDLQDLSARNLGAMLDPWGVPARWTANYAPMHLLVLAFERKLFGADPFGFHVVNAVLHALNALLFQRLLRATPLPSAVATLGAAVFLVHPCQMEAVAWMTQSKTLLAFGFSAGALLLVRQHPWASTLAFGLGLLSKASSSFALPVLAVGAWVRREGRRQGLPLALWTLLLLAQSAVQLATFRYAGEFRSPVELDLVPRIGQVIAIVGRYAVLAVSSVGASAYHQPQPPASLADPWLWVGVAALAVAAWRSFLSLRRRSPELIYWAWAAAGFAPVSQLLPFKFPLADRYLYFILPGLLGVACCLIAPWAQAWAEALRAGPARAPRRAVLAGALSLALLFGFALHARARAAVFRSGYAFMADSQLHYPDGIQGSLLRAALACAEGDVETALTALENAYAQGHRDIFILLHDPNFDLLDHEPRFRSLMEQGARWWIARLEGRPEPMQIELRNLAEAYLVVQDHDAALRALEQALQHPDTRDPREVLELMREIRQEARVEGRATRSEPDAGPSR